MEFDIVDQTQDPRQFPATGPIKQNSEITFKGFLIFLLALWLLFISIVGMVAAWKAIF